MFEMPVIARSVLCYFRSPRPLGPTVYGSRRTLDQNTRGQTVGGCLHFVAVFARTPILEEHRQRPDGMGHTLPSPRCRTHQNETNFRFRQRQRHAFLPVRSCDPALCDKQDREDLPTVHRPYALELCRIHHRVPRHTRTSIHAAQATPAVLTCRLLLDRSRE